MAWSDVRRWGIVLVGLGLLVGLLPVAQSAGVSFYDPTTGYEERRGVLLEEGAEDEWQGTACGAAMWWFTVELSVEASLGGPEATAVGITLPHVFEDDTSGVKEAVATPGEPVQLTVYQWNTCLHMTVTALQTEGPVVYEVTCLDGCGQLYLPEP